jgi:hypothetical protein
MPRCSAVQCNAEQCRVTWCCNMFPAARPSSQSTRGHYPCRECGGQAACGSRFSSLHHMASQSPDPLAPGTANNNERIRRQLEDSARRPDCGPYNRSAAHRRSLCSIQVKSSQGKSAMYDDRPLASESGWLPAAQASNHSRCPPHTQLREKTSVHVECSF